MIKAVDENPAGANVLDCDDAVCNPSIFAVTSNVQPNIFLYEDDIELADEIMNAFAAEAQSVVLLKTEDEVFEVANRPSASILIMDRMVFTVDSLSVIARLRESGNRTPVIVISNMVSVDDRIRGLKAGGDDYLIKPFSMGELIARVHALMRRVVNDPRETTLVVGDLVMDLIERTVRRGSRIVTLLPREFSLLEFFMRRPDQVITRAMMLEEVWKYRAPMMTNVVDVQMSNLRRKIDIDADGDGPLIRNKRGVGFIMSARSNDVKRL